MERTELIQDIRSRWKEFYTPSKDGKGIICPICGHGKGGDGIRENPKAQNPHGLKCFNCGFSGDILDLIQQDKGTDFNGALQYAAETLNFSLAPLRSMGAERSKPAQRANNTPAQKEPGKPAETPDFSEYYRQCREHINEPRAAAYLQARGISPETAAAFYIGYDKGFIIIPVSKTFYIARNTDPEGMRYRNPKGAAIDLFNTKALHDGTKTVFITEGAFDALSITEAGAAAVALNSVNNANMLLKQLEKQGTDATLVLCLDNDDAGQMAMPKLREGLQRLDISYIEANIAGHCKDANERLTADRAGLFAAVAEAQEQAQRAGKPDNVQDYISRLMTGEIDRFRAAKDRKTGYSNLDEQAGGLYSGLYVIAAISSLGKTTFTAQLADQLAAAGDDVIFFSLEQSRLELVSKSLARITAQNNIETAVSSLSIRKGYLPEQVLQAADDYTKAIGDRLSIVEGNFSCNVSFIGDYTRKYIKQTGKKPVLFIDYLQILQGEPDRRQSAKETVDLTVTELKRLSRELDITIFVISSVNRANYLQPIDFESLKESGGIEFTADVIWGLQLQCLNDPVFDTKENIKDKRAKVKEAKAATPRKIELVCLKNRYGISSFSCYFDYYPANDLFVPGECAEGMQPYKPQRKAGRKM